jgi:phage terminase small subunit
MGEEKPLNLNQARFVAEYVKDGNATRAAIAAGYTEKNAKNTGYGLLQKPAVQAAVDEARDKLALATGYNLRAAVEEIDQKIQRAEAAEQYTAVAKMLELKLKVHGMLVEKHEVRAQGLILNIQGFAEQPPIVMEKGEEDDFWS